MKKTMILFGLALAVACTAGIFGKSEKDYQREWATAHGIPEKDAEVVCPGGRCDILKRDATGKPVMAIEVEFAKSMKVWESIGQALRYAQVFDCPGGILYIVDAKGRKYVDEAKEVIAYHRLPITVYEVPR